MKCTHCRIRFARGHVAPDPALTACPRCARPLEAAADLASLIGFRMPDDVTPQPPPTHISAAGLRRIGAALADVDAFVAAERASDQLEGFAGPPAAARARRELLSTPPSSSTNATT